MNWLNWLTIHLTVQISVLWAEISLLRPRIASNDTVLVSLLVGAWPYKQWGVQITARNGGASAAVFRGRWLRCYRVWPRPSLRTF